MANRKANTTNIPQSQIDTASSLAVENRTDVLNRLVSGLDDAAKAVESELRKGLQEGSDRFLKSHYEMGKHLSLYKAFYNEHLSDRGEDTFKTFIKEMNFPGISVATAYRMVKGYEDTKRYSKEIRMAAFSSRYDLAKTEKLRASLDGILADFDKTAAIKAEAEAAETSFASTLIRHGIQALKVPAAPKAKATSNSRATDEQVGQLAELVKSVVTLCKAMGTKRTELLGIIKEAWIA